MAENEGKVTSDEPAVALNADETVPQQPASSSIDLRMIQRGAGEQADTAGGTWIDTPYRANTLLGVGKAYDLGRTQEKIALRILWILTAIIASIFFLSIVLGGWCFFDKSQCDASGNALKLVTGTTKDIFTAMLGLAGSVVGFYFGQRDRDHTSPTTTAL